MKESMWGYLIVLLGLVIVVVIFLVSNLTNTNEQDYFLAREVLKNSMYDAIDYGTYMKSGKIVMSKEKFVSIFTRRFAESVNPDRTFTLEFYDVIEYPPKATVRIKTETGTATIKSDAVNVEINTFLNGILETSVSRGDYSVVFKSKWGDCNGDGNFSDDDLPYIEEYVSPSGAKNCKKEQLDINGDGNVDKTDVILLKKFLYRGTPLDVNGDGEFDSKDVTLASGSNLTARQKVVADANSDGKIDEMDKKIFERCYKEGKCSIEDADVDGDIDNDDLVIIDNCLADGKCKYTYWKKIKYLFY